MSLRENLNCRAIDALRISKAVVLGRDGSVGDAIAHMQDGGVGCVVVTEFDKPIGIFTERDVLTKVVGKSVANSTPIVDVMTSPPSMVNDDSTVSDVVSLMHKGGFRHMPVVDDGGRLTGVISAKRIVEYLVDHFPSAVFNLPPDPVDKQMAREGA